VPKLPEAKGTSGKVEYDGRTSVNLLCIGESTIAGVGVESHQEGFSGTLASELAPLIKKDIQWEVIARSGYTAARVREKLIPRIKNRPDLIVVGLGGNDSFQLNSPNQWAQDILKLIKALKALNPEAPIFFTNIPPIKIFPAFTPLIKRIIGGRSEQLGAKLTELVKEIDDVYFSNEPIELETWAKRYNIQVKGNPFFSDGVHPSKLTYQVWAKDMASFIHKNY